MHCRNVLELISLEFLREKYPGSIGQLIYEGNVIEDDIAQRWYKVTG
jgi:hypothetical protein